MAALCENVETVIIAVLGANATFVTAGLTAYPFERDSAAGGERVVVKAVNAFVDVPSPSNQDPVAWDVEVMIEIFAKTAAKCMDVLEAVEEAMSEPTTAGVIATAAGLFPNGIIVQVPAGLEREVGDLHITRRYYPVKVLA